jgi:hypothetical protein
VSYQDLLDDYHRYKLYYNEDIHNELAITYTNTSFKSQIIILGIYNNLNICKAMSLKLKQNTKVSKFQIHMVQNGYWSPYIPYDTDNHFYYNANNIDINNNLNEIITNNISYNENEKKIFEKRVQNNAHPKQEEVAQLSNS